VVLWAHDDSIPAIARAEQTRVDGKRLRSRAVFADRDTHPLADTIFRLIKGKFIGAASVGWIPLKWQFVDEEGRGFGIDYLEQELLEWSVVNIPANPECLVEARSVGIDTSPLMVWAERALDLGGMSVIPRDELVALRRAAGAPTQLPAFLPARRQAIREALERDAADGDASDWKCGAARDLPVEDDDSWDGPAAEKAIFAACGFDGDDPDTAKARRAFLAYDASAPKKRGSYKLPFAKLVDGELKASAAGIRAAASRLPDTDIPQGVKDEGRKVLDGYEAKMGADDKAFEASATALVTLFKNGAMGADEFADRLKRLARAGRVLSAENEKKLQQAHDCIRAAHEHCNTAIDCVRSVIDANHKPDDDDPDDDDPEQASARAAAAKAAAETKQRQVARVLKLKGGATAA
jgi:HK97 family phage prohead protease